MHFSTLAVATLMGAVQGQVFKQQFSVGMGYDTFTRESQTAFDATEFNANVGDIFTFSYEDGDHDVVQSDFDHPCEPLDGGIRLARHSVDHDTANNTFPQESFTLNTTQTIWLFSSVNGDCQNGMSMVINADPSTGETIALYQSNSREVAVNQSKPNKPAGCKKSGSPGGTLAAGNSTNPSGAAPNGSGGGAGSGSTNNSGVGSNLSANSSANNAGGGANPASNSSANNGGSPVPANGASGLNACGPLLASAAMLFALAQLALA